MFGLGKEKYSREAFEEAEQQIKNAEEIAATEKEKLSKEADEYAEKAATNSSPWGDIFFAARAESLDKKAKKMTPDKVREEARKRLEDLINAGHKEALKLNEEYDRLRIKAEQAEKELEDFEREKLGMHSVEKK
jgi:hypothetical protein